MAGEGQQGRLTDFVVRPARVGDAGGVAAIYGHYVLHGTATFDTEPPSHSHWADKFAHITGKGWPFLVAEGAGGDILGYAYATQFRDRPAYIHCCENSLYVHPDCRGKGVGSALLQSLIVEASGVFSQMVAVIAEGEDASVGLHTRMGFEHRGRLHKVGLKFGKSLDTIYMQRSLTDPAANKT